MTIWRGEGGGGDATTDSEINLITSLANSIVTDTALTTANAAASAASALAAATSASNAALSEVATATSASAANTSAISANASANNAANSYDSFDDRYLGSKTVAPTLDNDGNTLLVGALYWNSVTTKLFVWSGTAWRDGFFSGLSSSLVTATSGQTVVTTPSYTQNTNTIQVYVNGLKVISGTDFTETSSTSITFSSGLTLGDEVEIVIIQSVSIGTTLASNVSYSPSGTISSATVQGAINEIVSDLAASSGSSLVGYLPSGTGAVANTVQTKLRESVSVKDFGAVGDGVTDDTTAIQNTINFIGGKSGGTVYLPSGTYKITSTISCQFPNILIIGDGSDYPHNTGSQGAAAGTKLVWAGAVNGTMLLISSIDGTGNIKYSGGGVKSIYFDSGCTVNGTGANYGIDLVSYDQGVFENLLFREFQVKGIRLRCITNLFDARDPQHNRFINCFCRSFVNQNGGLVVLEGDTAMYSGSGSGGTYVLANVSLNHFENCGGIFYNGIMYELGNSDHNFFINCRSNRVTGGTGTGILLRGANQRNTDATAGTETSDAAFTARKNVFIGFSGGSEITAAGTTSYTYASYKNIFLIMDDSNNTPYPTIETGALCYVTMRTNGIGYYPNQISGVYSYAGTLANAESMALEARKRVTTESLRIENGTSDGIRIARPATDNLSVTSEFSVSPVATSLNLRFSRVTGTGVVQMASGVGYNVNNVGSITLTNLNTVVLIDASASSKTVTLPLANAYGTSVSGQLSIRRIDASANTVTIQRQSTDTLNGGTSETLAANAGKTYVCDGTSAWYSF